jgi:hypothetical protein
MLMNAEGTDDTRPQCEMDARARQAKGKTVNPPLIVLKPIPLVVPVEIVEEFAVAVRALDQGRSLEEYPRRSQRSLDRPHDVRCAEIQAVLQELMAQRRGQLTPP